jgi:hypothetical protein
MHDTLESPDQNICGIKLSNTLTEDDLDGLASHVREPLEKYTTVRFLFQVDGVDGWEPEEGWEDLAFDLRHVQNVDKVAVLGDDVWDPLAEKIRFLFPESSVESFDEDDEEEAWNWVRGDMAVPGIGPGSVPEPDAGAQDEDDE